MFTPRDPKTFAERLMYLAGSSRSIDVAEWCGLPYNTINNYINTGRMPSAEALLKISESHSVNIHWLLTGLGEIYSNGAQPPALPEVEVTKAPAPAPAPTPVPELHTPTGFVGEAVIHVPAFELRITFTGSGQSMPDSVQVSIPLIKAHKNESSK